MSRRQVFQLDFSRLAVITRRLYRASAFFVFLRVSCASGRTDRRVENWKSHAAEEPLFFRRARFTDE